ncbi:MAG: aminoacyl-tRNA hydrolase [Ignavibacteriales bacterium]
MKLIVGIGNKGNKYKLTRHNVGFIILEKLADKFQLKFDKKRHEYDFTGSSIDASRFVLIKPNTYVNLSGLAVKSALNDFHETIESLLIISDDINLPLGQIRLRKSGGDGGHNGLSSIIENLESNKFPRLRFGIGNDFTKGNMADYVLSEFTKAELVELEPKFEYCFSIIETYIQFGLNKTFEYYSQSINKINSQITN